MNDTFACAVAFQRDMDERAAERLVRTRHGVAHFCDSLPRVWDRNFLAVDPGTEATAADLALEAEAAQSVARLRHRKISVPDEALGERVSLDFVRRGWTVHEYLVMPHSDPPAEVDTSTTVELGAEDLIPVWRQGIRESTPDDETVRQLVEAQIRRRDAVDVRYLAALANDRIAAYCELFSDGVVGQIESVMCLEEFRGRGLGKAVVARALAESLAAHELTFLVADAHDWPKELYRKLGFAEAGRIWDFVRKTE